MTLQKAIGVNAFNIDTKTGKKLTHSEVYGRIIDLLGGLDAVAQYIPFPIEVVSEAMMTDPNLNNLPLSKWDEASGFRPAQAPNVHRQQYPAHSPTGKNLLALCRRHGITGISAAEGVCILKETATRLAKRKEP